MTPQETTLPLQPQTKVKFCGLYREEDIKAVNQLLPDYIGFVLHFPKSHRNLSLEQARHWATLLHPSIQKVGVVVNQPISVIEELASFLNVIQLHGKEEESYLSTLRTLFPTHEFWKAYSVKTREDVKQALHFPADKILLDYGKGEGKAFDWEILEGVTKPYILAGGLTPDNVGQALSRFHPTILDLSSGIETNRQKDYKKMEAVLQAVKENRI